MTVVHYGGQINVCGAAEKLVLDFCEAEKLLIWTMIMCNVAS